MAHQRLTQVRSIISAIAATALSVVLVATVGPTTAVADEKLNEAATQLPYNSDMTGDVIYQLITDRFFDGDISNNNPQESSGLYSADKSNWQAYWGGDFAGVTKKMDYLKDLGVGAIWISPPIENVNVPILGSDGSLSAGYHGYWGMDFYVPEPHFGSWEDFDTMVKTAHNHGIAVIMDWAVNHTSPEDINNDKYGVNGALVKNGETLSTYNNDSEGYFHHNGGVTDYNDPYQISYQNLFNLADLAQENPKVQSYVQGAVDTWLNHGVDGIRMDAVKHMSTGFVQNYTDYIYSKHSTFIFGEWADTSQSSLWNREVTFANHSGQSIENFDLSQSLRDSFIYGQSMKKIDAAVARQQSTFDWSNQLVNFIDGHDVPRFLSLNNNENLFDQATVVNMTLPGIPTIYYGDEQYSHNDSTNGFNQRGGDPYNRQQMTSFTENTRNFNISKKLAALRKNNPALRYGSSTQRWINDDVYVYERQFYSNKVLVAVNKGTSDYTLQNLQTTLPTGKYTDILDGALGGGILTVTNGANGLHSAGDYVLKAGQAVVWSYTDSATDDVHPEIGNIGPTTGRIGNTAVVSGMHFGDYQGELTVGGVPAQIQQWTATNISFTIPNGMTPGEQKVQVTDARGNKSNPIVYSVLTGEQVTTNFVVKNALTSYGDQVYITGSIPELGNWSTDPKDALAPLVCPNYPTWFTLASVPKNVPFEYKYYIRKADGSIQWEAGLNHKAIVTQSGLTVETSWQNY